MIHQDSLNITVRVGCNIVYETSKPSPIVLVLSPRLREGKQLVTDEKLSFSPRMPRQQFVDINGNISYSTVLTPGRNEIYHDALVAVSSLPDEYDLSKLAVSIEKLPPELLRYTLPSRYCDTDKLLDFAWKHFGHINNGLQRVQAICDWTHENIEYRYGSGRSDISAYDVIDRRFGVCRDFAHVGIALCRAFNLPARYVTGHLPDINYDDSGKPMDFHAYFEVYLGDKWHTFDPRYNVPRIGRIKVAHGLDAVDGAFATIYGEAALTYFEVWAYQINPDEVKLGDPIDHSKRLDGKRYSCK